MGIAGLDKRDYPGGNIMQWLINNTNLKWTGFYLAPAPCQGNTSWMNKYNTLKNFGWGVCSYICRPTRLNYYKLS
jgi:hypothetical protein